MSNGLRGIVLCLVFCHIVSFLAAQEQVPLGSWRYHVSYNEIKSIDLGGDKVFASSSNGILVYYPGDQSVEMLTKLNGLSNTGITLLRYDAATDQLLVAYDNGTFDAIKGNTVRNIDPASNGVISGSKKINGITIEQGIAYFATDYGVLLFDLAKSTIKETWRDLGQGGATLPVYQSAFTTDSVFLATALGTMAGRKTENLLDFNKWKRFDTGDFGGPVKFITFFDNVITAGIDGKGLYDYSNGIWTLSDKLTGVTFRALRASQNALLVAEGDRLWRIDLNEGLEQLESELLTAANDAVEESNGHTWIGDTSNGLLTDGAGSFVSVLPDGPASDEISDLVYHEKKLYALHGGFSESESLGNEGVLDIFENGTWSSQLLPAKDLTSIAFSSTGTSYVSSFGYGVIEMEGSVTTIWDESNSTLINLSASDRQVPVTDVAHGTDGLWVTSYGTGQPLHLYSDAGWTAYSFPVGASNFPEKIIVDSYQDIWMPLRAATGGGILVFDPDLNEHKYLTNQPGNGALPSTSVYDVEEDRDGYVWVGTEQGVAFFYNYKNDAVRPIFESRFLLANEKVKTIAVDGGNRKWMGTERGAWLFNPTGEELIAYFTAENSPLPSNDIRAIEVNDVTGEVFISTSRGLCSFRADGTEATGSFSAVKIFPNPVYREFSGLVGITGLASDAIIKITDVSGKLVWQSQANGGTASWNVQDVYGRRVSTGIFLVYAVTQDGSESVVGKIAVIN
jgi:hypothetical protein